MWIPSTPIVVFSVLVVLVDGIALGTQHAQSHFHIQEDRIKGVEGDFEIFSHPSFPSYQLRIKTPQLCDSTVAQQAGFLDINNGAHSLFFWFFESRNEPSKDPLMLWLNGGPGCSSTTGLFFELGPCTIQEGGRNTTINPHSWTSVANIIFLDQPVGVGFSYASDGSTIDNSPESALDVYAFLQLFLWKNSKFAHVPFHVAAESYGGIYGPNIVSVIHKRNAELEEGNEGIHVNLESLILANAVTEPKTQFTSIPEYACDGPFPIYDGYDSPQCKELEVSVPQCREGAQHCYDDGSVEACAEATLLCFGNIFGPFAKLHLNPYDVRLPCNMEEEDDSDCYAEKKYIEQYMNQPYIKKQLGVPDQAKFTGCNNTINQAFLNRGDAMHNAALLLPPLLADGIRLLVFAGNADFYCNYIGQQRYLESLESVHQKEFQSTSLVPWSVKSDDRVAGYVRVAGARGGDGAGNYTFVEVLDAGHMAPHDQPEATLDMITRWLRDQSWD